VKQYFTLGTNLPCIDNLGAKTTTYQDGIVLDMASGISPRSVFLQMGLRNIEWKGTHWETRTNEGYKGKLIVFLPLRGKNKIDTGE
jgi:hypothetical protein